VHKEPLFFVHSTAGDHHHHEEQNKMSNIHYGLVGGESGAPRIAAYGAASILVEEPKAWTCPTCTFHNAETLGRFCSMCASPRVVQEDKQNSAQHENLSGPVFVEESSGGSLRYYEGEANGVGNNLHLLNEQQQYNSYDNYVKEHSAYDGSEKQRSAYPGYPHPQSASQTTQAGAFLQRPGESARMPMKKPPPTTVDQLPQDMKKPPPTRNGRKLSPYRSPKRVSNRKNPVAANDFNLQFSPEGAAKQKVDFSTMKMPDGPQFEQSFNLNALQSTPPFAPEETSTQESKAQELNERDFQMSFANWSISDQGAWACVACTFVNTNPLHLTCEVCGQKRPSKTAAAESQKMMQEAFSNSMRSGQSDFLRRQQEKIEEIEEKVLATARMSEITEIQEELFASFNDGSNPDQGYHHEDVNEKAQLAQEYIGQLESFKDQELQEQQRMEQQLHQRRQEMDSLNHNSADQKSNDPDLEQLARDALEVLGQERMLQEWKEQTRNREAEIERVRKRQQEIYERLQNM
jgi:hypothetical protein